MNKVSVFAVFCVLVFIIAGCSKNENFFLADYAKKFENEYNNYTKQIDENPAFSDAYVQRSRILEKIGDFKGALKDIKKAKLIQIC